MEMIILSPILLLVATVAFLFGYSFASEPTEEEMFNRLVRLSAERELQKGERSKIECEVAAASEQVVRS